MSQENVETVQRAVEAWNADDLDAFLAELDADVEWHPAIQPGLEGGSHLSLRGPQERVQRDLPSSRRTPIPFRAHDTATAAGTTLRDRRGPRRCPRNRP